MLAQAIGMFLAALAAHVDTYAPSTSLAAE